jgi:hypothetical protein
MDPDAPVVHLEVYDDYAYTSQVLRAAFNRVINSLESTNCDQAHARQVHRYATYLHTNQQVAGFALVEALNTALQNKQGEEARRLAKRLHRENRTAALLVNQLSRDLNDNSREPYQQAEGAAPPPVDVTQTVKIVRYMRMLEQLYNEVQASKTSKGRSTPTPGRNPAPEP